MRCSTTAFSQQKLDAYLCCLGQNKHNMQTFVKSSSVYFFNATVLGEVGVVKDFRGLGVDGVVDCELDAVNQGIDFVKLVQPHVDLPVDVFLEFVSAAWWHTKIVESLGHRVILECAGTQNSCDYLNEMALQQLPADSLSAWPREAACIESTVAAGCELCAFKW